MPESITIHHLFDNLHPKPGFHSLWGYALLIDFNERRLLFDTGSNGRVLLEHMKKLEIPPESIDTLFITHRHWDHIGGIDSVLEVNPGIELIVPNSLSNHLINDLKSMTNKITVIGTEQHEFQPGYHSTGVIKGEGNAPEQALLINSEMGPLLITGCAHPGIVLLSKIARERFPRTPYLVMGGFHLLNSSAEEIENTIRRLDELQVRYVAPSHCTGEVTVSAFEDHFSSRYIKTGAGFVHQLPFQS